MKEKTPALILFSLTLFVSAAAMFSLQPMAGKMLLPLVGGTPAGWVVAMAFFQVMLLAGYLLAHLFSRLSPRLHAALYLAIMGAGALFLPVDLARHASLLGGQPGPGGVFLLLAAALAVPFIALSATSSTIQRLFTTTGHGAAKDPYFLYAASNLGSFAGLMLYPLLIEPNVTLSAQAEGWSRGYMALIALGLACLFFSKEQPAPEKAAGRAFAGTDHRLMWLILSFFPSSLLMGVTSVITTDVMSAPMIWVIPLALYLLAFVAAFSRRPPASLATAEKLLPWGMTASVALLFFQPPVTASPGIAGMLVHLAAFTVAALYCCLRLVALRPDGGGLTSFYLHIAAGGALGGIFNAFIAPNIFDRTIEYPLIFMALALLCPGNGPKTRNGRIIAGLLALALLLTFISPPRMAMGPETGGMVTMGGNLLLAGAAFALADSCRKFLFPGLVALFILSEFFMPGDSLLVRTRNFFGTVKVFETVAKDGGRARYLMHGITAHGLQLPDDPRRTAGYYTKQGPIGRIFDRFSPRSVGVIGLGTGTLACYAAPDRAYTFFEIDPGVIAVAQNEFTYLSACKGAKAPRIVEGDGRLELEKSKETFDMIILDAFSSDAIPTHLLTREAMESYLARLAPRGTLVLHVSNRYFNLAPVAAATARSAGLDTRTLRYKPGEDDPYALGSTWIVAARKGTSLAALDEYDSTALRPGPDTRPWTDDYTNLLSTLEILHAKAD